MVILVFCTCMWDSLLFFDICSTRKRQSVVCRYPNGRLVLYCKVNSSWYNVWVENGPQLCRRWVYSLTCWQGADTVIYERLADRDNDLKRISRDHLEQFGAAGLRTLCLAYRDLNPEAYENWNEKFIQAKSSLRDREKKLDEVCPKLMIGVCSVFFILLLLRLILYMSRYWMFVSKHWDLGL